MDLSFVMKLVAKELGLPPGIVEELKGARIEIVESESTVVGERFFGTEPPSKIEWPGVCVRMLVTAESTGTFPVTITIPNLVLDRLPISVHAKICEVSIG